MAMWRRAAVVLLFLAGMVGAFPVSAADPATTPLDVDRYCGGTGQSFLAKGAIVGPNYAYDNFQCKGAARPLTRGDMQKMAKSQYSRDCVAVVVNPDSAYGWAAECHRK